MKNSVKITIVLGIVTYFFPVYPMATSSSCLASCNWHVEKNKSEQTNPLLHMNNLHIPDGGSTLIHVTRDLDTSEVFDIRFLDSRTKIRDDDPLYTDKGLALSLAVFKVLKESDRIKNEETLKTICDAVSEGTPVISKNSVIVSSIRFEPSGTTIYPRQNHPISIFNSIEDWFKCPSLFPFHFANSDDKKVDKTRLLMEAIFKGEHNRKEQLAYIQDKLATDIKIEIPRDIISVLVKCLQSNVGEERTRLIEEAEQKFKEEQQS